MKIKIIPSTFFLIVLFSCNMKYNSLKEIKIVGMPVKVLYNTPHEIKNVDVEIWDQNNNRYSLEGIKSWSDSVLGGCKVIVTGYLEIRKEDENERINKNNAPPYPSPDGYIRIIKGAKWKVYK